MDQDLQAEINRLRWQCRRGMLELDLAFGGFVDKEYAGLDRAGRDLFQKLLKEKDQDILEWLYEQAEPTDPAYIAMLKTIRSVSSD